MELTSDLDISDNSELKIEKITVDSEEIFKRNSSKNSFPEFYCFDNSDNTTSSEELNFNNLKKCLTCCTNKKHKFLVLNFEEKHISNPTTQLTLFLPKSLHGNKKTFSFEFKNSTSDNTVVKFDGKLMAILHQGYKPTENSS